MPFLRFGDPAGPYPGGHPDEWTPRQRAVVSTVAAIGIQHFRYTIGSSPRFGLSATLYGRAVLAGPKFSRPFIRELKCVVKLEAMTEPRPYVLLEYDWEATKRGYVGSFEIDEGDSGDEELHEPALSLTIFSFGRQGIDRLITVLSGMTAEQPLALSASLVEATSENEIAPEGAPAGPHGWVCDWDFHSEKAAKVVENESPCLMIWCETKEYCRNRRYCQRARRASEA